MASFTSQDLKLAVVIPAYKEERHLPRTIKRVPPEVSWIIIVDDGSPDRTFEVAQELTAHEPRAQVIRLGFNYGVGRAIIRGYERAAALGAQVIVVMAGDDQMDPEDMPALIAPILRGEADYVKGDRLSHPEAKKMPPLRRFGTRQLARLTGIIAGVPDLDDAQCGYTAISAELVRKLPLAKIFPRYGYPNDMILRITEVGGRIAQVPVRPVYADEISGLKIHKVIAPISKILLRGAWRRLNLRRA